MKLLPQRVFRSSVQFSSVQLLSCVQLFVTPWTVLRQASLSITNSWSLLELMSIESVMPSNHLTLGHPLLLPPSIFPSIRVFSNESVLCITWPKYWSFSFSICPSNEHLGLISSRMDLLDLLQVKCIQSKKKKFCFGLAGFLLRFYYTTPSLTFMSHVFAPQLIPPQT